MRAARAAAIAALLAVTAGLGGCASIPVAAIGSGVMTGISLYCDGVTAEGKQMIRDATTGGKQILCGHPDTEAPQ